MFWGNVRLWAVTRTFRLTCSNVGGSGMYHVGPFARYHVFGCLSLTSDPGRAISSRRFSSSCARCRRCLCSLTVRSISMSRELHRLLRDGMRLVSLGGLFAQAKRFRATMTRFCLSGYLLLIRTRVRLIGFNMRCPKAVAAPSSFLSSLR